MHNRWVLRGVELVATAAIFAVVWIVVGSNRSYIAVPVPDMLKTFWSVWTSDHLWTDALPSLRRLAIGYVAAVVISVSLGFLLGMSRRLRLACLPVMGFVRAIPPVALLPIFLVVFGVGDVMRISIIVFVCAWPILLNTLDGLGELDATMMAATRSYHIAGWDRLFRVLLPAISPRVLAGMRTSLSLAVLLLVASEMLASSGGIGFFLFQSQQAFKLSEMWAAVILLGLLGYVLNVGFSVVERRLLRWHASTRRD